MGNEMYGRGASGNYSRACFLLYVSPKAVLGLLKKQ